MVGTLGPTPPRHLAPLVRSEGCKSLADGVNDQGDFLGSESTEVWIDTAPSSVQTGAVNLFGRAKAREDAASAIGAPRREQTAVRVVDPDRLSSSFLDHLAAHGHEVDNLDAGRALTMFASWYEAVRPSDLNLGTDEDLISFSGSRGIGADGTPTLDVCFSRQVAKAASDGARRIWRLSLTMQFSLDVPDEEKTVDPRWCYSPEFLETFIAHVSGRIAHSTLVSRRSDRTVLSFDAG